MKYNKDFFDQVIDRNDTLSIKYDVVKDKDIIPMWVADMDFRTCDEVVEALTRCAQHGIYGYSDVSDGYLDAVVGWMKNRHHYEIEKAWIVQTPGIVFAINHALQAFTNEGDKVIVTTPIYHPFVNTTTMLNRCIVKSEMILEDGEYRVDYNDFEQKIKDNDVKVFILCSPHNPLGKEYTYEELETLLNICNKYNVLVISDEIHMDFELFKHQHVMSATINKAYAQNMITCTSPSKTFNLAGLQVSNIIIENEELRNKFKKQLDLSGFHGLNVMALHACESAYRYGNEWLDGMLAYLENNISLLAKAFPLDHPYVKLIPMQATYLAWLDCRGLNLDKEELKTFIEEKVGIKCNMGDMFFDGGEGFIRLNLACPSSVVEKAICRMQKAINEL